MKKLRSLLWVAMLSVSVTVFFSCSNDDGDVLLVNVASDANNGGNGGNDQPQDNSQGAITLYSVNNGEIFKIRDYSVSGDDVNYQRDIAKHEEIWDLIRQIVPLDQLEKMSEFMIYNGSSSGSSGYVVQRTADLSKWQMGIAINYAYLGGFNANGELAYTIIHEFGHILTLNDSQLDASISERNCPNYFPGEGCAESNSYINEMYQLYWKDIASEHKASQGSQRDQQFFYNKYRDRFVTNYASTNPAEDMAEIFAMFITMRDKPLGNTIAEKKILLMYDRSELIAFRNHIRQNLNLRGTIANEAFILPAPGAWKLAGTIGNPMKTKCRH
jgi:hypothetical protein